MSDQSGGPGWWLASNGKWYPPAPGASSPAAPPPPFQPATSGDSPGLPKRAWRRYRSWPLWAQIVVGVVVLAILAAPVHVTRRGHRTGVDDLEAADGWTYHYIHVNNDTPGTDDGKATRAQAFPANIVAGAKVTKVQVVGYMGDSGNAESTAPHLHFEIRQPAVPGSYQGTAINAYPSLQQATHWNQTSRWDLRRTATAGPSDEQFTYGMQAGDRGLLCDWDGDGRRRGRDLPCRHLAPPRQHQRRCHHPGPPLPPSPSARRATSRSWATAPTR